MKAITGFAPIADDRATVLILGSMPGVESLSKQQYYAHPRNSFWYIIGEILGIELPPHYQQRQTALKDSGIALWDVLQACSRKGSLDSAIDKSSVITNNFGVFYASHNHIRHVFFNGKTAEGEYRRHVLPALPERCDCLHYYSMPSTSPAMATLNREQKLASWLIVAEKLKASVPAPK